jgi:hypothetical protein
VSATDQSFDCGDLATTTFYFDIRRSYLWPMRHWRILEGVERAPITVVEVEPFPAKAAGVWNDEERLAFISFIANHPDAGDLIPGSGGVRKVRWSLSGTGKRGGVRVIYYFHDESIPLFLLTVYPKSRKDNLSAAELKAIKQVVSILRSTYGKN